MAPDLGVAWEHGEFPGVGVPALAGNRDGKAAGGAWGDENSRQGAGENLLSSLCVGIYSGYMGVLRHYGHGTAPGLFGQDVPCIAWYPGSPGRLA